MQIASTDRDQTAKPLVSVVMAACNVEPFLAQAIESILAQSYKKFEFIIVDFGSTDSSKAIAAGYAAKDERIKLSDIPHCVLPQARNAACSYATGKYAAVMDADDVAYPERLALQVEFLERHPEVKALGGAVEWIDTKGASLIVRENPLSNAEIQAALQERCPLWHPSAMVSLDAFRAVGGYRDAFVVAQDYDLWLRMAEHYEIANLPQVVLQYRIHPYQVSLRKQIQQTLNVLAARASSEARRSGQADPLDGVQEVTPELLLRLGVSPTKVQNELLLNRLLWIRNMCMAGEVSAALEAGLAILKSDLTGVERSQIADLQLTISSLYWRQKEYGKSLASGLKALLTRPILAGRPFKPLLQRLRWV